LFFNSAEEILNQKTFRPKKQKISAETALIDAIPLKPDYFLISVI